jgi:hypothetical protein
MNDERIENYLKQSTRGLWGRKRSEVREELLTHIEGRVHAHMIAGLSETEAIDKTLSELGTPKNVSYGMTKLYTLPIAAGSGIIFAAFCVLAVAILTASTAQTLKSTGIMPVNECLVSAGELPAYCYGGRWISVDSLKEALESQGVTFNQLKKSNGWELAFPEGKNVLLNTRPQQWNIYYDDLEKPITLNTLPDYISLNDLILAFSSSNLAVRLEGWEKPVINLGDTKIEVDLSLSKPNTHYTARDFFAGPITWGIFNSIAGKTYFSLATIQDTATQQTSIVVNDKEGTVYGLTTIMNSEKVGYLNQDENVDKTTTLFWDIAQVDKDGKLSLRTPLNQPLTFLTSPTGMYDEGHAVLVRLSGDLSDALHGYVVVPPELITLER